MDKEVTTSKDVTTINLESLFMPISILLSALVLTTGIYFGLGSIGNSLKGGVSTNTTATADTTTTTGGAKTVTMDQITALYSSPQGIKFGDSSRAITFVEFSDPSCPYCHIASGLNGELNTSAGSQFTLVEDGGTYVAPVREFKKLVDEGKASYMWFYTNGHGNGETSTKALYCGNDVGAFWELHDAFYSAEGYSVINDVVKNNDGAIDQLLAIVPDSVDKGYIKSCIEQGKYNNVIADDAAIGTSLGVAGTPGFFINEVNFAGAYNYTDMQSTVDSFLN
jgi:protein-disulfide isomerase